MSRGQSLIRVLKLARRLERVKTCPMLQVLAEEFKVHPRTIRRDLEALEQAGWRVPQRWYEATTWEQGGR